MSKSPQPTVTGFFPAGTRFAFVPIRAIAAAVNSATPELALPSFQRDAVWDERHIEVLWDSILRGFPIGAILLARPQHGLGRSTRKLQQSRAVGASPIGAQMAEMLLIDGQQRCIALAAGFRAWQDGDQSRLWIDLAESTSEKDGVRFRVVLCTVRHPWGFGATDPQKRDARKKLGDSTAVDDTGRSLGETWPVRAVAPVPLAEYLQYAVGRRAAAWAELLPKHLLESGGVEAPKFLPVVTKALQKVHEYELPANLIDDLESVDALGTAFQRLNKQGVEMSGDDLFFSGLKLRWPPAHDLVWEIYRDDAVGRFLSPPKIVHVAARLATNLKLSAPRDLTNLDVEKFRRLVEAPDAGKAVANEFLSGIRFYLDKRTGQADGRLHRYLRLARSALTFRPTDERDPGLPTPLLAQVRWGVWHALVVWLAASDRIEVSATDRLEMIRFALMDLFCIKRHTEVHAGAQFKAALESPAQFPGRETYHKLRDADPTRLQPTLFSQTDFANRLLNSEGPPEWALVHNERLLAMWAQRAFLTRCFPDFDPTRFARDDLPYDVDHILAAAHLARQGHKTSVPDHFYTWRDRLQSSAGNLRYWPKGANRADGDDDMLVKQLLGAAADELPPNSQLRAQPLGLRTCGEVRAASFIPEEDVALWTRATQPSKFDWSDPARLDAFREATMRRRVAMYNEMFDVIDFAAWM